MSRRESSVDYDKWNESPMPADSSGNLMYWFRPNTARPSGGSGKIGPSAAAQETWTPIAGLVSEFPPRGAWIKDRMILNVEQQPIGVFVTLSSVHISGLARQTAWAASPEGQAALHHYDIVPPNYLNAAYDGTLYEEAKTVGNGAVQDDHGNWRCLILFKAGGKPVIPEGLSAGTYLWDRLIVNVRLAYDGDIPRKGMWVVVTDKVDTSVWGRNQVNVVRALEPYTNEIAEAYGVAGDASNEEVPILDTLPSDRVLGHYPTLKARYESQYPVARYRQAYDKYSDTQWKEWVKDMHSRWPTWNVGMSLSDVTSYALSPGGIVRGSFNLIGDIFFAVLRALKAALVKILNAIVDSSFLLYAGAAVLAFFLIKDGAGKIVGEIRE